MGEGAGVLLLEELEHAKVLLIGYNNLSTKNLFLILGFTFILLFLSTV